LTWSLEDVVKYHIRNWSSSDGAAFYLVMNKQKWDSLPKDVQQIIDKLDDEEWIERAAVLWQRRDDTARKQMRMKGNIFVELSKEEDARWAARMKPVLAEYVQTMKKKGLPGDEVLKFCQDYLKKNDKFDYMEK
jgi:TRAP-type C4-dicarboxylate transport system substrate-binding protein